MQACSLLLQTSVGCGDSRAQRRAWSANQAAGLEQLICWDCPGLGSQSAMLSLHCHTQPWTGSRQTEQTHQTGSAGGARSSRWRHGRPQLARVPLQQRPPLSSWTHVRPLAQSFLTPVLQLVCICKSVGPPRSHLRLSKQSAGDDTRLQRCANDFS